MYNIYCENGGLLVYLTDITGERVRYTQQLADEQLSIFEQLPFKSKNVTWHKRLAK